MNTNFSSIVTYYRNHVSLCNFILLICWLIINLVQAAYTELAHDEAYYWMYAQYLDYGYFDHPPAIALIIKAGFALFQNEFGVRLFIPIMGVLFVWICYLLTNRKDFLLFFLMITSVGCLQLYGFIAVPDSPLLFFTATFFLLYKRWIEDNGVVNSILLGLNIAALLYCKYHGILILFFTLISNLNLLRNKWFYVIVLVSLIAYIPHIVWQVSNGYPSYQYHVLTKSQDAYKPVDTVVFILGQLMITGPLTGIILFFTAFRYRPQSVTEKALKFSFVGILLFFLFSTLNAPVEANWTVVAIVPMIILSYNYITNHLNIRKWMIRLALISSVLILFMRINLVTDFVPTLGSKLIPEFYGWENWAKKIQKEAKNTPVVFTNSYQKASKYSFYTQQLSLSLNNIQYRRNQYDLWGIEDSLQGRNILYIPNWKMESVDVHTIHTAKEDLQYLVLDNFRSYAKIEITTPKPRYRFKTGELVHLPLVIKNNYNDAITFGLNNIYPDNLVFCLFREEEIVSEEVKYALNGLRLKNNFKINTTFTAPKIKGTYYLRISIKHGWLPPAINSRLIRLTVE